MTSSSQIAAVAIDLRRILPAGAVASVWDGGDPPELYPDEASAVARAVPSRRTEFSLGRACARRALAELGIPALSIPVGASRQPVWPDGFVGSITHTVGLTASVAAPTFRIAAIGLDAEPAHPLPDEVRRLVLTPSEMRQGVPVEETVIFSAKEAVYKALFPRGGRWLDFLDVEVTLDTNSRRFAVRATLEGRASDPRIPRLVGVFAQSAGYVLTLCHIAFGEG